MVILHFSFLKSSFKPTHMSIHPVYSHGIHKRSLNRFEEVQVRRCTVFCQGSANKEYLLTWIILVTDWKMFIQ